VVEYLQVVPAVTPPWLAGEQQKGEPLEQEF
jgi:hypothetical protein